MDRRYVAVSLSVSLSVNAEELTDHALLAYHSDGNVELNWPKLFQTCIQITVGLLNLVGHD